MNEQTQPSETAACRSGALKVLREAVIVSVIGALLALAANEVSPRGLRLARDYFPEITPAPVLAATNSAPALPVTNPAPAPVVAASNSAPAELTDSQIDEQVAAAAVARLKAKGLQVVSFDEVKKLLHDPGYRDGSIIFIDARDDEHYQAGHIPGAYQLDYYHPDKYLATVLAACQKAGRIVVYCTGGDCEDSELTALLLRDGGVPNGKLFVYSGGITEWDAKKEPIEAGARNSGQRPPNQ